MTNIRRTTALLGVAAAGFAVLAAPAAAAADIAPATSTTIRPVPFKETVTQITILF